MLLIKKILKPHKFTTSFSIFFRGVSSVEDSWHSTGLMQNLQTLHACIMYLCACMPFKSYFGFFCGTEVIYMVELSTVGWLFCNCVVVCYKMLLCLTYHVCLKKALSSARRVDLYFVDNRTYNCKCTATVVIHILTKWAEDVQVDYLTNTDGNTWLSSKKLSP